MKSPAPAFARGMNFLAQLAISLALLLLPVTSLPLLSKLMLGASVSSSSSGTSVAPPSVVFILCLALGWLPVYLLRGGKLPGETAPFLVFVVVALIASAAAFFLPILPNKGYIVRNAELKALITLAMGVATYLIITLWHRQIEQFKWALWLINISGILMVAWSLVQLYYVLFNSSSYPPYVMRIQTLFSTRDLINLAFHGRVLGFSFEPSWLAHQLNVLFIPYWLAATVTGYSVTKKLLHVSMENVLLVVGLVVWYYTLSRVGLVAFALILGYLFYRANLRGLRWLQNRLRARLADRKSGNTRRTETVLMALLVLALFVIYVGGFIGFLYLLPHINHRFGSLLKWQSYASNLLEYAFRLGFAERVVYWSVGWEIFARYPVLGVGLGNAGFFFPQMMPNLGYRLTEITALFYNSSTLPNIKSFWLRLLAESGLVGFSLFVAWQYVQWHAGKFLRLNGSMLLRTLGWMGTFTILAFLVEGFSVDSFALPYLWVSMGLLSAAAALARNEAIDPRSQQGQ